MGSLMNEHDKNRNLAIAGGAAALGAGGLGGAAYLKSQADQKAAEEARRAAAAAKRAKIVQKARKAGRTGAILGGVGALLYGGAKLTGAAIKHKTGLKPQTLLAQRRYAKQYKSGNLPDTGAKGPSPETLAWRQANPMPKQSSALSSASLSAMCEEYGDIVGLS